MADQMRVKPTSNPLLPTGFTQTGADGNTQYVRLGAGIAGKAFDARVTEHGDQWVAVNGPVVVGGVGPQGTVVPQRVDVFGNPIGPVPLNATSVAYENSRQVKASGGTLYGFSGYNSKASTQFILVLDYANNYAATIAPPAGTIPVIIIAVAAASNFSYDPGKNGRTFGSGIWIANSSTGPTLTAGSADCWFDVQAV